MGSSPFSPPWLVSGDLPASPFELFGLKLALPVSNELLESRYRELSRQLHPDHAGSTSNRAEILRQFAAVNSAYRILKNPAQRVRAFAQQVLGVEVLAKAKPAPEFLLEIVELQEMVDDIISRQDHAEAGVLRDQVSKRLLALIGSLETDPEPGRIAELNYLERIMNRLEDEL